VVKTPITYTHNEVHAFRSVEYRQLIESAVTADGRKIIEQMTSDGAEEVKKVVSSLTEEGRKMQDELSTGGRQQVDELIATMRLEGREQAQTSIENLIMISRGQVQDAIADLLDKGRAQMQNHALQNGDLHQGQIGPPPAIIAVIAGAVDQPVPLLLELDGALQVKYLVIMCGCGV
jgi:vacuolar-type H+-ATPase subunit H